MHRDLPNPTNSPYHKWLDKLNTCQGEIKSYQRALANVVNANKNDGEVVSLAKKFRSDFSRKLQEIDQHLQSLQTRMTKSNQDASGQHTVVERQSSHLERFTRTYSSLKNCYQMFLADIQNT